MGFSNDSTVDSEQLIRDSIVDSQKGLQEGSCQLFRV